MEDNRKILLRGRVSAIPAPNHKHRFRGGPPLRKFGWGATPIDVVVVENPVEGRDFKAGTEKFPRELSPAWWDQIRKDPHLKVLVDGEGEDSVSVELRAQLKAASEALEKARREFVEAVEKHEEERGRWKAEDEAKSFALKQAEQTIASLQARLSERNKKAAT